MWHTAVAADNTQIAICSAPNRVVLRGRVIVITSSGIGGEAVAGSDGGELRISSVTRTTRLRRVHDVVARTIGHASPQRPLRGRAWAAVLRRPGAAGYRRRARRRRRATHPGPQV